MSPRVAEPEALSIRPNRQIVNASAELAPQIQVASVPYALKSGDSHAPEGKLSTEASSTSVHA
ncbi:MAG: hypothetical protein ACJ790_20105, partial [Myxococcaceae bacterium]